MKHPKLKFRYAIGLGDIIACFLHSKLIGWLTRIVTGKDEPCQTCSQRIQALNFLFPIKLWRLFFKTQQDFFIKLSQEMTEYKKEKNQLETNNPTDKIETPLIETNYNGYKLINNTDNKIGDHLIRLQIYKIQ